MSRARVPVLGSYKRSNDRRHHHDQAGVLLPYMAVYLLFTSPASFEKAGKD